MRFTTLQTGTFQMKNYIRRENCDSRVGESQPRGIVQIKARNEHKGVILSGGFKCR